VTECKTGAPQPSTLTINKGAPILEKVEFNTRPPRSVVNKSPGPDGIQVWTDDFNAKVGWGSEDSRNNDQRLTTCVLA